MTSPLPHRSRHLALLCLLASATLPLTAAQARPWLPDSLDGFSVGRVDNDRRGDRHRDWLQDQRARAEQTYAQTQRRLDQLERCLDRSRPGAERDQCLRLEIAAQERQWQRDQRDWQLRLRRQGRIAQLSWPLGD